MTIDEDGNPLICHPSLGLVFVVDADGVLKVRIMTALAGGKNLTDCTFGGPDGKMLFTMDSIEGNVQCVQWHCRGVPRSEDGKS